jgi:hypothetical protein
MLAGFPGESLEEYTKMAELVPLLVHLNPPCSCAQVRLDRFSPFHFRAKSFGFERVRPSRAYFFVFPLGRREMSRFAYFFDFDYADDRKPQEYLRPVQKVVQRWWDCRVRSTERPRLDAEFDGDEIVVTDSRPVARAAHYRLKGLQARIFSLCDVAATLAVLLRQPDLVGREDEVRAALESLVADGLMAREEGHYLTLGVFRNRTTPLPTHIPNAYISISQTVVA